MPKINLLPPQDKKEIELSKINRWLTFFYVSLLVLVIVFTLLCFSSYLHLSILINAQQKQIEIAKNDEKGQELEKIEIKINSVKQQLSKISNLQGEFICWTPILEKFAEILPTGIYFHNLSLRSETGEVKLSGHADLREQVVKLSDEIKADNLFSNFDLPLSSLVSKENIDFVFNFNINTSTASCHFEN